MVLGDDGGFQVLTRGSEVKFRKGRTVVRTSCLNLMCACASHVDLLRNVHRCKHVLKVTFPSSSLPQVVPECSRARFPVDSGLVGSSEVLTVSVRQTQSDHSVPRRRKANRSYNTGLDSLFLRQAIPHRDDEKQTALTK